MDRVNTFKAAVSSVLAVLSALWGWFGWLIVAWIVCMTLDYLTGTAAAIKNGTWSSQKARDGLWHKAGCIAAVAVSGILDLVAGHLADNFSGLPFAYTVLLCPLAVVWYILTEAGSILENADALNAPLPHWLRHAVTALREKADQNPTSPKK